MQFLNHISPYEQPSLHEQNTQHITQINNKHNRQTIHK